MSHRRSACRRSRLQPAGFCHVEVGHAVNADLIDAGLVREDCLGAVAMMEVPVEDEHTRKALGLGIANGSRQWIQDAVAVAPVRVGVVSSSAQAVGACKQTAPHLV